MSLKAAACYVMAAVIMVAAHVPEVLAETLPQIPKVLRIAKENKSDIFSHIGSLKHIT